MGEKYIKNNISNVTTATRILSIAILAVTTALSLLLTSCSRPDPIDSVKVAVCAAVTDIDQFEEKFEETWKAHGHTARLEFYTWKSDKELPQEDTDVFIYDAMGYHALRAHDIFAPMDDISTSYAYEWTGNMLETDGHRYCIPMTLCTDVFMYDKSNQAMNDAESLYDIRTSFDTPLLYMNEYYLMCSIIGTQDTQELLDLDNIAVNDETMKPIYYMSVLMGQEDVLLDDYAEDNEYLSGESECIYDFTEKARTFEDKTDNLAVKWMPLTEDASEKPVFYIDVISLSKNLDTKERKVCSELVELLVSEEFQYKYHMTPTYGIPANVTALKYLAVKDDVFAQILNIAKNENNRVALYGRDYYEEVPQLNQMVDNKLIEHY